MFDSSQLHTSNSLRSSLVLLPKPENMSIAVGILLLSCIQAEILRYLISTSGWWPPSLIFKIPRRRTVFTYVSPCYPTMKTHGYIAVKISLWYTNFVRFLSIVNSSNVFVLIASLWLNFQVFLESWKTGSCWTTCALIIMTFDCEVDERWFFLLFPYSITLQSFMDVVSVCSVFHFILHVGPRNTNAVLCCLNGSHV